MSSEMVRWGGLAGLAAGLMYLLSGILTLIAAPQITDNSRFLKLLPDRDRPSRSLRVNACHHSGSARPSARALRATRDGGLLANLRRLRPRVGERTPHHSGGGEPVSFVRLMGGLVMVVGSILLGVMTLYARVLPWWGGVLLIVSFPLDDILDLGVLSESIVFAVVWGSLGYALFSRGAR
jgi:hypothetical protein